MATIIDRDTLRQRIAASDAFSADERAFLLLAVTAMPATTIEIQDPPSYLGRIEQIFAYLAVGDHGEGIVAAPLSLNLASVPLIAADKTRLDQYKPVARSLVRTLGRTLRLARFKQREDLEILRP